MAQTHFSHSCARSASRFAVGLYSLRWIEGGGGREVFGVACIGSWNWPRRESQWYGCWAVGLSVAMEHLKALSGAQIVENEKNIVWNKLQILRRTYLDDMVTLQGMLTARSNQPMPAEQLQKLRHYRDVLNRMIPYVRAPQERIPKDFNTTKVDALERQIVNIITLFKRRRDG